MTLDNALWMLTALAAVVVLLTRMRLSAAAQQTSGHAQIPQVVVNAHTLVGVLALAVWVSYLVSPSDLAGWASLVLWWVLTLIGLGILARWLPGGGRHAADATQDGWANGPALSVLGHVGMALGVIFFTYTVLAGRVG